MDEFKDLEEEISKLDEGLTGEDFLSRLRSPAPGDYWKKRLEDEKELWNKTVEAKEQENRRLEKKLQNTEEELKDLRKKLSEIELGMQKEAREWEERMRNKDTEMLIDRERAAWSAKLKEAEKENEGLKARVDELKSFASEAAENSEKCVSEVESAHKHEMEKLIQEHEHLVSYLDEMVSSAESFKMDAAEKQNEIKILSNKIGELTAQKERLEAVIKIKEKNIGRALIRQQNLVVLMINYLAGSVKKFAGLLLGLTEFCARRLERTFFFGSTSIKRQLAAAGSVIGEMMEAVDNLKAMMGEGGAKTVPVCAARFVSRLDEDADVSGIPRETEILLTPGFNDVFRRLKGMIRKAAAVYRESPAGGELELKIILDSAAVIPERELTALEFFSAASGADFEKSRQGASAELILKFQCQKYS